MTRGKSRKSELASFVKRPSLHVAELVGSVGAAAGGVSSQRPQVRTRRVCPYRPCLNWLWASLAQLSYL